MRTSRSQFVTMVQFMEINGDLAKPTGSAIGRKKALKQWEKLRKVLNADPTGDPRTIDKWKKVWSDFKLNAKKKAAKINRAINVTGGGPAPKCQLTSIEKRVIQLVGAQSGRCLPEIDLTPSNPTSSLLNSDLENSSELITLHAPRPTTSDRLLSPRSKIIFIEKTAKPQDQYHRFAILMAAKIRSLNDQKKREDCMKLIRDVVSQFVENNKTVLPDASQSNFDASQSNFDASQSNFDASQSNFEDSVGSQQTRDELSSERSETEDFEKNDTVKDDVVLEGDDDPPSPDNESPSPDNESPSPDNDPPSPDNDPPSPDNFEDVIEEHEIVSSKHINDFFDKRDDYQCLLCSETLDDGEDPRRHLENKHPDVLENIIKEEHPDSDATSIKSIEEIDSSSESISLPSKKRKSEMQFEKGPKRRSLSSTKEDHETKTKDNKPSNNSSDVLDIFLSYIKVLLINMPPDLSKKVQLNVLNVILTA